MKVESGYSYDGNRTTVYLNKGAMGQETQEYAHNIVNQYTTIDRSIIGLPLGGSVGYDDNGNLTTDKEGYGYSYDYRNRIEEIEEVVQFSYDALGRRIRKTDSQSNITTYYIYDPDNRIIAQYTKPLNDEASLDRTFVYGNDLHEVLAMFLARNEGNPADWDAFLEFVDAWLCTDPNDACYDAAYDHNSDNIVNLVDFAYFAGIWDLPSNRESNWYYLHDVQGSVMGIIGGRLNRPEDREFYTYDVYGNPSSLSAVGNPFMFHGKFVASTQPLVYSRFYRDYQPNLGRWMQFDPIGYVDGVNLYEFNKSNPVSWTDLFGLFGTPGQPWPGLPIHQSTTWTSSVGTFVGSFEHFLFGGGKPAEIDDYYTNSWLYFRPQEYEDALLSKIEQYKKRSKCEKHQIFQDIDTLKEVVTLNLNPAFAQYYIPVPNSGRDMISMFGFEPTFGSIDRVDISYLITIDCGPRKAYPGYQRCGCPCTIELSADVTLHDNYNFLGGNNLLLRALNLLGTPYDAKGRFVDYKQESYVWFGK